MAATDVQTEILSVAIPAAATLIVAIVGAVAAYVASKRERRRRLYGEAFRAASAWSEMLYRVRRRGEGAQEERDLVGRFHAIQEELDFYTGWIGSESKYLQRSYQKLIRVVKTGTCDLINESWRGEVRAACEGTSPTDLHPDFQGAKDLFLLDVRSHLSLLPWRRIAVIRRNYSKRSESRQ